MKPYSDALFTDLYELTMAQAYWRSGVTGPATFSLFFRKFPQDRAYFVFAGLGDILEYLESLRFNDADIEYLKSSGKFDRRFLEVLSDLRFTGQVRAMREGTICFTEEPVIEVQAPIIEAQLVETYLLNQATFQTSIATKASRVIHAAKGRNIVDFGARRTQGLDAAIKAARCSYMVGFNGTSNVQAAALYGISPVGTMAHSFIMSFEREVDAFRAYAHCFPDSTTLLVDTYDSLSGVRNAIEIAREMALKGHRLSAVRLDSGDLLQLAIDSRALLDAAGLQAVQIFASGGLDEFEVDDLLSKGAPIDGFGVGTKVVVSADAPYIDSAYKLVEYGSRPVLKLSAAKQSLPGCKQVFRMTRADGRFDHDVIGRLDDTSPVPEATPLLGEVMHSGQRFGDLPALDESRSYFAEQFRLLPDEYKKLRSPDTYR
ncbi:MAG: nicotinate phosphoribosyltransferase, partial [Chloroflexi bacterium]|nr:nicotinate phosphoribosyltransferase [Chloroflexota bacterium]